MVVLTFLGVALAAPASPLFQQFQDLTSRGPVCFTPLVEDAQQRWSTLSSPEQAELATFLAPFSSGLTDTPPPPPGGGSTCWGQKGASQLIGPHFTVEWDAGVTEIEAQKLLDAFEEAYVIEVDELGWAQPKGMDQYNLFVYVANEDGYAGAYTTAEICSTIGYMPYIVVSSGTMNAAGDWYQDCAAHELNHASQQAYGLTTSYPLWWWEATATWMEEHVFVDNNGWGQHTYGFAEWPEIAMQASSQSDADVFWHMYGMSVWAFYLDEYVGGHDFVRGMWEHVLDGDPESFDMPDILADFGVDFDETWAGFLAATTVMDFREHNYFYPVDVTKAVTELPFEDGPDTNLPGGLGQNYIRIETDAFQGEYAVEGALLQATVSSDEDFPWHVVLVTTDDSQTVAEHAAGAPDDSGNTVAQIPWDGSRDAWLVVSPGTVSTSAFDYTYTLALVEPPPPVQDTADTGVPVEEEDPTDAGEPPGGCACASSSRPPELWTSGLSTSGWIAAFAALSISRRRRRLT